MASTGAAAAVARGSNAMAAAWLLAGAAFLLLTAAPFAHASYSGLAGRLEWFAVGLALSCFLAAGMALAGAPVAALLTGGLFLGGIGQLWLTEPDWFSAVVLAPHSRADIAMLGLIALEAVLALAALWRTFGTGMLAAMARSFGLVRPAALLALLTICSVSLFRYLFTHDVIGYAVKLVMVGVLTGIHLAAVCALLAAPDLPRLAPLLGRARRLAPDAGIALALFALLLSAALALLAFHGLGAVEDETAYLFQARTYAAGMLVAPPLPAGLAPAFDYYLLDPRATGWLATTSPGWPAVLALGVALGVPWLVNPLLAGLTVLLAHRLVRRCADRWVADLVALLLATSPWLIGTAGSLMTHSLSGALIAGAWLSLVVARDYLASAQRGAAMALALLAGLLFGWLFLTRALEGVLIGGLTGLWLVWTVRARNWPIIAPYALGCLLTGVLLLAYNAHFTGDPLTMPLTDYLNRLWGTGGNDFGFGPGIGPPEGWRNLDLWPGHSPAEGLVNTLSAMPPLNLELFGWPIGSLVLIGVLLLWGRLSRFARAMAVIVVAVIGIHLFYWFNAVFYVGPRYWYTALLPLVILSAFGARTLVERLEDAGIALANERVVAGIALMALFGVMIFMPWRGIEKYSGRVAESHALERWAAQPRSRDMLVLLPPEAFKKAAILDDPLLRPGKPIFAQDLGPAAAARIAGAFPRRHVIVPQCDQTLPVPVTADLCAAIGKGE